MSGELFAVVHGDAAAGAPSRIHRAASARGGRSPASQGDGHKGTKTFPLRRSKGRIAPGSPRAVSTVHRGKQEGKLLPVNHLLRGPVLLHSPAQDLQNEGIGQFQRPSTGFANLARAVLSSNSAVVTGAAACAESPGGWCSWNARSGKRSPAGILRFAGR